MRGVLFTSSEEESQRILHQQVRRRLCQRDTECSPQCKKEGGGHQCCLSQDHNEKCLLNANGNVCNCGEDPCYIEMRCNYYEYKDGNLVFRWLDDRLTYQNGQCHINPLQECKANSYGHWIDNFDLHELSCTDGYQCRVRTDNVMSWYTCLPPCNTNMQCSAQKGCC